MNQIERQWRILNHISTHETISLEEAVASLKASPATIRRDFTKLVAQGKAERFHGGVRRLHGYREESSFGFREQLYSREKDRIARQAATLLRSGDVLMVDGGTSTFHLADHLPDLPLRLITNSLRLAAYLTEKRGHDAQLEIFLTGGFVYPQSNLLVGPLAKSCLRQYHANWAFLSAGGIGPAGVFNTTEIVVECEQIMIENSDRTVILADHSKIGQLAMCRVCDAAQIDVLATDSHPDHEATYEALRREGVELLFAPAEPA